MVNHILNTEANETVCRDVLGDIAAHVSTDEWPGNRSGPWAASCPDCIRGAVDLAVGRPVYDDNVNHPSHYTWLGGIEVIDVTEHMGFCLGNVVKYVLRADHKGEPIQDLEKAAWYLAREIENRKKRLT